jgi:carboxyl-terminal processing protease
VPALFPLATWVALAAASAGQATPPAPVLQATATPATPAKRENPLLSCQEMRARTRLFLDLHLVHKDFTEEISRRSFSKFFELLDSDRLFFTHEDLEQFKPLEDKLGNLISKKNCSFLDNINAIFLERVKERVDFLPQLLRILPAKPLSSAPPELTKKFAKNRSELDERWHQRYAQHASELAQNGFVGSISERLSRRYQKQLNSLLARSRDDTYSDYLNSFALSLDPHSAHFLPAEQDEFNSKLGNPTDGVGLTFTDESDFITIEAIAKGSSAEKSGVLKVGDELILIDKLDGTQPISPKELDASLINRIIRGKKDTKIRLTFERPVFVPQSASAASNPTPSRFEVTLTREIGRLKSILARSALVEMPSPQLGNVKLGIIKLPTFYTNLECRNRASANCQGAASDVLAEVARLKDAQANGILLDLRNNNGGDLQESIRIAGLFFSDGPVIQILDRTGVPRIQSDPDPRVSYAGPLVVLINKNTASAAEIVVAALKDHRRAIIAGDSRTFGKGTIQVIQDLSAFSPQKREGMLKITQATFYSPLGKTIQKTGVESDLTIPSPTESSVDTEAEKDFAISTTPIPTAPHMKPSNLESANISHLAKLKQMSAERISAQPELLKAKSKEAQPEDSFPPAHDPVLQEGLHILADYVLLGTKNEK